MNVEEIFSQYKEQGWDAETKYQLLCDWLGGFEQRIVFEEIFDVINDFKMFLDKVVEIENF